jgi:hypothetical protein
MARFRAIRATTSRLKERHMQSNDKTKSFAFKLANDAQKKDDRKQPWQARDGVAIAGCSGPDARADRQFPYRRDGGIYC